MSGIAPILGFIPPLSGISNGVSLLGTILILYAYWKIGRNWQDPALRQYAHRMIFLALATALISVFLVYKVITIASAAGIDFQSLQDPANLSSIEFQQDLLAAFSGSTSTLSLWSILLFITLIFWAWFFYQANKVISQRTGNDTFRIGGLFMMIGIPTVIVFGLGFLLSWISYWILFVAFLSFPEYPPVTSNGSSNER